MTKKTKTISKEDGVTTKTTFKTSKKGDSLKVVKRKNGKLVSKTKEKTRIKSDGDDLTLKRKSKTRIAGGYKSKTKSTSSTESHKSKHVKKEKGKKRQVYKSES